MGRIYYVKHYKATHMSEEKNLPKWIPVAAAVTTLSIPFFYIFGYAYDQGHLQAYGISNEFFARSPQEYLVLSFFACLAVVIWLLEFFTNNPLPLIIFALIIGGITLVSVFAYKHRIAERLHGKSVSIQKHRLFDYIFFPFISASLAIVAPFMLTAAISMILLVPAIAFFNGKNIAEKEILNTKACTYSNAPTEECVFLLENGKPIASGRLVARSPSHIALFNQGKATIYPVKDQHVEVIPPSKKPKGEYPISPIINNAKQHE